MGTAGPEIEKPKKESLKDKIEGLFHKDKDKNKDKDKTKTPSGSTKAPDPQQPPKEAAAKKDGTKKPHLVDPNKPHEHHHRKFKDGEPHVHKPKKVKQVTPPPVQAASSDDEHAPPLPPEVPNLPPPLPPEDDEPSVAPVKKADPKVVDPKTKADKADKPAPKPKDKPPAPPAKPLAPFWEARRANESTARYLIRQCARGSEAVDDARALLTKGVAATKKKLGGK
jgi:hypothetical protein